MLGNQLEHVHGDGIGHDADKVQATLAAQGGEHGAPVEVGVGGDQEKIQGAGNGIERIGIGRGDHLVRAQALGFVLLAQR
ncbi:hypothetical protein D3C87_1397730 [compost metagenome]